MLIETEKAVATEFMTAHAADAARVLETYPIDEFAGLMQSVPLDTAATVLGRMNPALAFQFMESLSAEEVTKYLGRMPLVGALPILRRCSRDRQEEILNGMKRDAASLARRVLRYPESAAGTLANPHACTLPPDISVRNGTRRLRNHPTDVGACAYVVDRDGRFRGYVPLHKFFRARLRDRIASIMQTDMHGIAGYAMPEDALKHPDWERFHELPVLGENDEFIGSLSHAVVLAGSAGHRQDTDAAVETAVAALDDLYRIGFTGMLKGAGGSLLRGK